MNQLMILIGRPMRSCIGPPTKVLCPEQKVWFQASSLCTTRMFATARRLYCTSPPGPPPSCERIPQLDPFCRTRFLNNVKKLAALHTTPTDTDGGAYWKLQVEETDVLLSGAGKAAGFVAFLKLCISIHEGSIDCTATGIASTRSAAETACCMHGERLMDALGIPLYTVALMQNRHAQEARRQGRWAPMAGEALSAGTPLPPLPPPLFHAVTTSNGTSSIPTVEEVVIHTTKRSTKNATASSTKPVNNARRGQSQPGATQQAAANKTPNSRSFFEKATDIPTFSNLSRNSRRRVLFGLAETKGKIGKVKDETEGGQWTLVNVVTNRLPGHDGTMLTPAFIDPLAVDRSMKAVASLLLEEDATSDVETTLQHLPVLLAEHGGGETMETGTIYDGKSFATCRLEVPFKALRGDHRDKPSPSLIASGRAQSQERARLLMGMHLELLLDYYGLPLYPNDDLKQQAHLDRLLKWRPARCFNNTSGAAPTVPPLPLKELSPILNEFFYMPQRAAPLSMEEKFIRYHGQVYNNAKTIVYVNATESEQEGDPNVFRIPGFANAEDAGAALEAFQRRHGMRQDFFVLTDIGGNGDDFRCTTLMYNLSHPFSTENGANGSFDDHRLLSGEDISSTIAPMGAIGFGSTIAMAKTMCIAHALELLARHNIALFEDSNRQEQYTAERRQLLLHASSSVEFGHVEQVVRDVGPKDIEDDTGFLPRLAKSGPAVGHYSRRSRRLPPESELRGAMNLSSVESFVSFPDPEVGKYLTFFDKYVQEYMRKTQQPDIDRGGRLGSSTSLHAMTLRGVVQDEGTAGKHRSTSWRHVWVPATPATAPAAAQDAKDVLAPPTSTSSRVSRLKPVESKQATKAPLLSINNKSPPSPPGPAVPAEAITCMGRGIRMKEGDRLCYVHMGITLGERGLLDVPSQKMEEYRALMAAVNRPATPFNEALVKRFSAPSNVPAFDDWALSTTSSSAGGGGGGGEPADVYREPFKLDSSPPLVSAFYLNRLQERLGINARSPNKWKSNVRSSGLSKTHPMEIL